jgi:SAM-dependent methyltransferase
MNPNGFSLNLGAKDGRIGSVRADIDRRASVNVFADARQLPFRNSVFDEVVFSEVLEHLPHGSEGKALREIYRVMKRGGRLILTTPHWVLMYAVLDPAFYLGHRHYRRDTLEKQLKDAGFRPLKLFRGGGLEQVAWNLLYDLGSYLLGMPPKLLNGLLAITGRWEREMIEEDKLHGYTLFVVAIA